MNDRSTVRPSLVTMMVLLVGVGLSVTGVFVATRFSGAWWLSLGVAVVLIGASVLTIEQLTHRRLLRRSARLIVKDQKLLEREQLTIRPARDRDRRGLKRRWYDQTTRDMQSAGLRMLGDFVIEDLAEGGCVKGRAVLRVFLSECGTIEAAIAQVKLLGWARVLQWSGAVPRFLTSIELETELTDGSFVITNQTALKVQIQIPPDFDHHQTDGPMEMQPFRNLHEERVSHVLAQRPGVTAVRLNGVDDVLKSQKRQQRIKSAFRRANVQSGAEVLRQYGEKDELDELDQEFAEAIDEERQRRDREP